MTWFIKNKMRKLQRKIKHHNEKLVEAINKYNELATEYQGINNFAPINFGQQQEITEQTPPEQNADGKTKKAITKNNSEVVIEL